MNYNCTISTLLTEAFPFIFLGWGKRVFLGDAKQTTQVPEMQTSLYMPKNLPEGNTLLTGYNISTIENDKKSSDHNKSETKFKK